jgi:hypothetical protein
VVPQLHQPVHQAHADREPDRRAHGNAGAEEAARREALHRPFGEGVRAQPPVALGVDLHPRPERDELAADFLAGMADVAVVAEQVAGEQRGAIARILHRIDHLRQRAAVADLEHVLAGFEAVDIFAVGGVAQHVLAPLGAAPEAAPGLASAPCRAIRSGRSPAPSVRFAKADRRLMSGISWTERPLSKTPRSTASS